jgi:hypothetical protein
LVAAGVVVVHRERGEDSNMKKRRQGSSKVKTPKKASSARGPMAARATQAGGAAGLNPTRTRSGGLIKTHIDVLGSRRRPTSKPRKGAR